MDIFQDKVAIVTGGASGIGRALCQELGQRGAAVIVADINDEGAEQVASAITAKRQAEAVHLDVSQEESVQNLIDETASEHGRLDYIFNNAGIGIGGEVRDLNLEDWRTVIDVNLMGVLYGTTIAYKLMVQQGFGHIVNTASLAGLIGYPTNTPYATTKYAVIGLSNSLRLEAAELGVKVSVVCPGYVDTGIYAAAKVMNISQADKEKILSNIPFKLMDVTKAAHAILRGVERNKAIITFPAHARLLWWLYRLHPSLLDPLGSRTVEELRAARLTPEAPSNDVNRNE
jgi:NAD(P)-dependent dehydrogenase (short-subunit alcohol dehydrogenase family)